MWTQIIHVHIHSLSTEYKLSAMHRGYNSAQEGQSLCPYGTYILVDSNASDGSNVLINSLSQ